MARLALAILLVLWGALRPAAAAEMDAPVLFLEGVPQESGLATLLRTETVRAHAEMGAWFGVSLDRPITVRWVTSGDDMEERTGITAGAIAGAARADRNEILLFAPALVSRPERIVPVLRHEMNHLLFARAAAGAEVEPPRWLDEGIAMWRSGEWDLDLTVRRDRSAWLRDAAIARQLFTFEELDGRFPSGPLLPLAYAQSASFVEWIDRKFGEGTLSRFVREIGKDAELERAARTAFGEDLSALEEEWRDDIAPRGPFGWVPSEGVVMTAVWGVLALLLVVAWARKRRKLHNLPEDDEPPAPPLPSEGSPPGDPGSTSEESRG